MPTVSVVIPATNRPSTLDRAVAAVRASTSPPEELIVVDEPELAGPAAARNLGAARATGDVLVFLDADVEIRPDALARIRDVFDRDPGLTAVFGSYDDDPEGPGVVSDFRNLLHHHVHHENAGAASTFWAGLGAIRRDAFVRVGGFDETSFPEPSVEDIELGIRLVRRGASILLDPSIQGKHLKRWTLATMVHTDLVKRGVPWLRLMLEDGSSFTALNLGWRHRLAAGASLGLAVALGLRKARLAGAICVLVVAIDGPFYLLLYRRRGPTLAAAAVPLHVVHRLTSVAAVPLALAGHALARRRGQSRSPSRAEPPSREDQP